MCGIAGYAGWTRRPEESEADLRAMCGAIRHRGPDDEGHFVGADVALGMRRLSIIDVAGGSQPIANEDGRIWVVFNGEIYNHRELQHDLEQRGHLFATRCDTEALVHGYEEKGARFVRDLCGMFAIALWDTNRQRLLLCRDRLGIKPLYYREAAGGLVFASELRSMLALGGLDHRLDRQALARYLALGYVPDPDCIFQGVRKLPPGHTLTWGRNAGLHVESYWSPTEIQEQRIDAHDAVEELRTLISQAVGSHLESEVPLGAFLSGGIDSSTVVAEMARQMDRPVQTFSIGFDVPSFNEAPHAAVVARSLGTEHTELIVRPDVDVLVEDVVRAFDEPFADSSALPTYLVSRLARERVTVALSGDGGDELFGGYTRYAEVLRQRETMPSALRGLVRASAHRLPHGAPGRNRLLDMARSRQGRYATTVAVPLPVSDGGVALPDIAALGGSLDTLLGFGFAQAVGRDFATQMMVVDLLTYLPGDILTKVDRMGMAVSLETRVPLLDHRLAEFALSLPSKLKLRDGTGKWILRQAIADLVPAPVLQHPKQGFGVPLVSWFRNDLRHRVASLDDGKSRIREFVDAGAVHRLAAEHLVGRRDHSLMLWRLLVLDLWLTFLDAGDLARDTRPSEALAMASARGTQTADRPRHTPAEMR